MGFLRLLFVGLSVPVFVLQSVCPCLFCLSLISLFPEPLSVCVSLLGCLLILTLQLILPLQTKIHTQEHYEPKYNQRGPPCSQFISTIMANRNCLPQVNIEYATVFAEKVAHQLAEFGGANWVTIIIMRLVTHLVCRLDCISIDLSTLSACVGRPLSGFFVFL